MGGQQIKMSRWSLMRTVKIISCYAGFRGEWNTSSDVSECLSVIKFQVNTLKNLNQGVPMDAIFVNQINEDLFMDSKSRIEYATYLNYLDSLQGAKIPNGKILIEHRKNIGAMNGAYSYARKKYRDNYDYFWFSEDDRINVSDNVMAFGINQLKDTNAGFVTTTSLLNGMSKPRYMPEKFIKKRSGRFRVTGGAGITSNEVLGTIFWTKKTRNLYELPHFNNKIECTQRSIKQNDTLTHQSYEHSLANIIYNVGYDLSHLSEENDLIIHWKNRSYDPKWGMPSTGKGGWVAHSLPWSKSMNENYDLNTQLI